MRPTPIALAIIELFGGLLTPRGRYCVGADAYVRSGAPWDYGRGAQR